jgi:uncharacterized protein
MNDKANGAIEAYLTLRAEISLLCDKLHEQHKSFTLCANGCDACCLDFSVFPVEFFAVLHQIQSSDTKVSFNETNGEKCALLNAHSCSIYPFRPVICRSHGLPLLYMDAEGEEWQLSFCELNFTEAPEDLFDFENTYPQDTFNSRLFLINQDFIREYKEHTFKPDELIPLCNLKNYLKTE